MRNFVQEGDRLTIISTGAVVSGALVVHGLLAGIALNSASASGQDVTLQLSGVVEMPKEAGSFGLGILLYANASNGRATTTASGNRPLGYHAGQVANAGAAGTACLVLLQPTVHVTTP